LGRRLLITALTALCLVAPAGAQSRALWPGVSFETGVQFTPNGPIAINILMGPRPASGATTLAPVLSNESLTGTETLTAMQRRIASSATTAGVNGDFFTFATGVPTGVFMRDGQVASPPSGSRSSAGVTADGTLDIRRISFFGTWQGTGGKRSLSTLNEAPPANGAALYTPSWGQATPALPGSVATVLFPFPAAVPNADLQAPVVETRVGGGAVPIPIGGAVLVARGPAAAALTAEAPVGGTATVRLIFRPDWPGVVAAIGGGPQIVRNGAPVFRAGEAFTSSQLSPRSPRTGIGQLADGRIVLVAVDGRQPGYSVGMTNFELAQALVRLGAVTGMAFDGGGSTSMAFDGGLLNRPSGGGERPISTALMFVYTGVFVQPAVSVVSPDGDGVADRQSLRYKLVRPSTITVTLTAPDGSVAYTETAERQPGSYSLRFPPPPSPPPPPPAPEPAPLPAPPVTPPPPPEPPPPPSTATTLSRAADPLPADGRWKLSVAAADDTGQPSEMTQEFTVNTTLGYLETAPRKLFLPPLGRDLSIGWRQARPARVVVTVETPAGEVVRTLARRRYAAGDPAVVWNGLDRGRKAVKGGKYVIRVVARNTVGTVELTRPVRVQRIVGPKGS
jgi:exopolysaccharide biosynthesis protein